MDKSFWHQKWETNDIGFHESEPNPLLVKFLKELALTEGDRVFVPLCGKTLDIPWLLSRGFRVVGAELSPIAVGQLFDQLGVVPEISVAGEVELYSAEMLDIFVGDMLTLSDQTLGPVDAIYDRAALVALPMELRTRYATRLMDITGTAPQLLICFEYDQNLLKGPPFSVSSEEVGRHYEGSYDMTLLSSTKVPGGLKGRRAARENVWLLKRPDE